MNLLTCCKDLLRKQNVYLGHTIANYVFCLCNKVLSDQLIIKPNIIEYKKISSHVDRTAYYFDSTDNFLCPLRLAPSRFTDEDDDDDDDDEDPNAVEDDDDDEDEDDDDDDELESGEEEEEEVGLKYLVDNELEVSVPSLLRAMAFAPFSKLGKHVF